MWSSNITSSYFNAFVHCYLSNLNRHIQFNSIQCKLNQVNKKKIQKILIFMENLKNKKHYLFGQLFIRTSSRNLNWLTSKTEIFHTILAFSACYLMTQMTFRPLVISWLANVRKFFFENNISKIMPILKLN